MASSAAADESVAHITSVHRLLLTGHEVCARFHLSTTLYFDLVGITYSPLLALTLSTHR